MNADREPASSSERIARTSQMLRLLIILMLLGSLLAITGVRQFMLDPISNNATNGLWFALQILPLLLVLPGLLRGQRNGFVYCALAALLYLVHGIMLASDPQWQRLGMLEAGLALALTAVASRAAKAVPSQAETPV